MLVFEKKSISYPVTSVFDRQLFYLLQVPYQMPMQSDEQSIQNQMVQTDE